MGWNRQIFKCWSLATGASGDILGTCTPPASKHLTFDVCMDVIATVSSAVSFDGVSVELLPALMLSLYSLYSWVFFIFLGIWVSMSASLFKNGTWVPQFQVLLCVRSAACCLCTWTCHSLSWSLDGLCLMSLKGSLFLFLSFPSWGWVRLPDGPLSWGCCPVITNRRTHHFEWGTLPASQSSWLEDYLPSLVCLGHLLL